MKLTKQDEQYVLIFTYATQLLINRGREDAMDDDEQPIMALAIDKDALRKALEEDGTISANDSTALDDFLEYDAVYDDLEDIANEAINEGKFAFAVVNGMDEMFFPDAPDQAAMQALWEYMRSETLFEHIRRLLTTSGNVDKHIRVEGGCLVFGYGIQGRSVRNLLTAVGETTIVPNKHPFTIKEA